MRTQTLATAAVGGLALAVATALPAAGANATHQPKAGGKHAAATGASTFSTGQLQAQTVGAPGCGTNDAGEPAIHVSKDNLVALGSERGFGGGSQLWGGTQVHAADAAPAGQLP